MTDNPQHTENTQSPGGEPSHNGKATASMVLGIIGLVGWLLPIIGLPVTITGLVLGIFGRRSEKQGAATAGVVMSIIGLVLSLLNSALGVYLEMQNL